MHKSQSLSQLADRYGVTPKTLRRWLILHDLPVHRRLYSPKEIDEITDTFG